METREQSASQPDSTLNPVPCDTASAADAPAVSDDTQTADAGNEPEIEVEIVTVDLPADAAAADAAEASAHRDELPATLDGVLDTLAAIAGLAPEAISRDGVGRLKGQFYAIRKADIDAAMAAHVDAGNSPDTFITLPEPREERLKELLEAIRVKKAEYARAVEAEQAANAEAKSAIIERLNVMAEDTDNVNRLFPEFRELQERFKTIGDVPPTRTTELWKSYQEAVERFYDRLKINKDLRDYDFRKNLEAKTLLCEEAERLDADTDVVNAFRRMQTLQQKWRETGPVAKEEREAIWLRFKDASAVIYKKYQAYFEERKAREQENEAAKTALCERIEALDFSDIRSFIAWEEMTRHILAAQEEWKQLGFASRRVNNTLFARFRQTCDKFFTAKAEFFHRVKDELAANLEAKTRLCERAEALAESTEWRKATDEIVALQKEWRTIGGVPKRNSETLWRRFQKACDTFFARKKEAHGDAHSAEQANMQAKHELIEELRALQSQSLSRDEIVAHVKDAQARWGRIGHVPFKEKDRLFSEFRAVIDALFERRENAGRRERVARFESRLDEMDSNGTGRERERLCRILEQQRSELKTCENNLGFFSSRSKSGDEMLRDIERRIERLRKDMAATEDKIRLIDSKS